MPTERIGIDMTTPNTATLPITQATRKNLWSTLTAHNKSADVWKAILNQIPQNYIKPFSSPSEYLAQKDWEATSDSRVYATDQALVATYNTVIVRKQPLTKAPAKPPGGTAPGQGGDIGGANPGLNTGLGSILDFLKNLLDPHWWLRVGEFIMGVLLIGVGAAKLSDGARDTIIKYAPVAKGLVK